MKKIKKNFLSLFLKILVYLSALVTIAVLFSIVGYILIKGVPVLNLRLFEWEYNSDNVSMMPAIINTVIMTIVSLLIAVPIGVFSAIYLVEYAKRGNKFVSLVRITTETLSGIPSIVYGLFGALIFVEYFHMGKSILAGALTMSIMILPIVMRTTEEALISVPDSFREGSFGLGAGKLRTVFKVVLPFALPGVLSGVILSIGRIVGETAALIYTAGTVTGIPDNLLSSGRTLSIHMYALWNEGINAEEAYATAVILLVVVIIINTISARLAGKLSKKGI
ncbi:MAG: phosphate ABC transporter permease PstA [Lachnospiraceae bacterium]|nr:phosphate ABC transporter permease PstA [Lachnospiraceae bacterium]